jgi:ABC-2 type transport system permease protein
MTADRLIFAIADHPSDGAFRLNCDVGEGVLNVPGKRQAFLDTFLVMTPFTQLPASPRRSRTCRTGRYVDARPPFRHFLVIVRGVFLKDMPPGDVAANIVQLILIAVFTLSVTAWLFRQRME